MRVIHVLADGTQVNDIVNHVVTGSGTERFYDIINKINSRRNYEKDNNNSRD